MDGPVLDLQTDLAADAVFPVGETVRQLAADHTADDAVLIDAAVLIVYRFDRSAVAQNGDPVSYISDLIELMGDDDRGHTLLLELQKQVEKHFGIFLIQGGGRLVENEQLHVFGKRLGDFDKLLLAGADVLDERMLAVLQPNLIHVGARLVIGAVPVDAEAALALIAEEHVFSYGELRDQSQLLMDDDDPELFTVFQRIKVADLTVVYDVAAVASKGIRAGKHVHQGGFSGAVFADKRVDLAAFDLEIHIVERPDARKLFCDVLHHKNMISQLITLLLFSPPM